MNPAPLILVLLVSAAVAAVVAVMLAARRRRSVRRRTREAQRVRSWYRFWQALFGARTPRLTDRRDLPDRD